MKTNALFVLGLIFLGSCSSNSQEIQNQSYSLTQPPNVGDTVILLHPEPPIIVASDTFFYREPQFNFGDDSLNSLLKKNISKSFFIPDSYRSEVRDSIYFVTTILEFDSIGTILSILYKDLDFLELDSNSRNFIRSLKFNPAYIRDRKNKTKRYINDTKIIEVPYYFEYYKKHIIQLDLTK